MRPDEPSGESPARRPTGVAIIALLTGISGLLSIVIGLLKSLLVAADLGGGFLTIETLVDFVIGAAGIFLAWGTWNLKLWAWTIQVILTVLGGVVVILQVLGVVVDILGFGGRWFDPLMWGLLLLEILILYYLLRPSVRVAFGRTQPHIQ